MIGRCPALALGLWLLGGCNGAIPPPAYPHSDARAALAQHAHTRRGLEAIRAEARVDQRGREGRIKGTVLMFVARPAAVRFDVMTQFGPVAILTSDGERFQYADLRESRFTTGETCPQNVARILGLPMSVEETTAFLLGGTGLIDAAKAELRWHDDGFYRITLSAAGGARQEVDLGIGDGDRERAPKEQRLRLLRSELYAADGKSLWQASYDEYRPLPLGDAEVLMPFEVRVVQVSSESDTLIRFKEIAFEDAVAPEVFHQEPRPGMQHEEADCDGP